MPLPHNLDTLFTAYDRQLLASYEHQLGLDKPKPVVSIEAYCSLVDACDFANRQNYLLRRQRRKLFGLLRRRAVKARMLRARGLYALRQLGIGALIGLLIIGIPFLLFHGA